MDHKGQDMSEFAFATSGETGWVFSIALRFVQMHYRFRSFSNNMLYPKENKELKELMYTVSNTLQSSPSCADKRRATEYLTRIFYSAVTVISPSLRATTACEFRSPSSRSHPLLSVLMMLFPLPDMLIKSCTKSSKQHIFLLFEYSINLRWSQLFSRA